MSWSEVVCPCGIGVSFGPSLLCCIRVTSAMVRMVDGVAEGEVRSDSQEKVPFHQRDDGFPRVRSCDTRRGNLIGVSGATSLTLKGAKTVKMARPRHNCGLNKSPSSFLVWPLSVSRSSCAVCAAMVCLAVSQVAYG